MFVMLWMYTVKEFGTVPYLNETVYFSLGGIPNTAI
jgi:hypothetical protein